MWEAGTAPDSRIRRHIALDLKNFTYTKRQTIDKDIPKCT